MQSPQSIKNKVIAHKREWLIRKTHNLKKEYDKALWVFQHKLHSILQPTINEAFNLLTNCEQDVFLGRLYSIGIDLEKCVHHLYEINLLHSNETNSDASDDEFDDNSEESIFHSSIMSSPNRDECGTPLSPFDFFAIGNCQPQIHPSAKQASSCDIAVGNFIHSSLSDKDANAVANQRNGLCSFKFETKYCQTDELDTCDRTCTAECQTDYLANRMISVAVQTDISNTNYSTSTLLANTKYCQTEEVSDHIESSTKTAVTIAPNSSPIEADSNSLETPTEEEADDSETNVRNLEVVDVIKDASDVSSIVDDVFAPCAAFTEVPNPQTPIAAQSEPISELAAFEEYAASQCGTENESCAIDDENDLDLLLIHNIEKGQRTCVNVCHVVSPSSFSVQPKACEEQLIELQNHINVLYASEKANVLAFRKPPAVGTICVAIFHADNSWYRAKVIRKLSDIEYEVLFIDYGDCSIVPIENMSELNDPMLANVPQFSIQCSLCGVEPVCENGVSTWSESAISWFHQQVFNKFYDVLFVTNYDDYHPSTYSVHLLCQENNQSCQTLAATVSVANKMVSLGYASFATQTRPIRPTIGKPMTHTKPEMQKSLEHIQPFTPAVRMKPTIRQVERDPEKPNMHSPFLKEQLQHLLTDSGRSLSEQRISSSMLRNSPQSHHNSPLSHHNSPLSHHNSPLSHHNSPLSQPNSPLMQPFSSLMQRNSPMKQTPPSSPVRPNSSMLRKDSSSLETDISPFYDNSSFQEDSSSLQSPEADWDPMTEDFVSERNRYDVNVDDACVAVENVDPAKTEICRHFAKGDCWRGKNCNRPHISDPDVLYQVQVLSGHNLSEIELEPEELVIVKVITDPDNEDFYAHLVPRDQPGADHQSAKSTLECLSQDLKSYYSKVGTRQSVDKQVCIGEVYVVLYQDIHCRVTVLDISRLTRIQVLLVDYGKKLWLSPSRLLVMSEAFMHLPKQAILCTYDKASSRVDPMKDCCYFANVGETLDPVDAPTLLALLSKF